MARSRRDHHRIAFAFQGQGLKGDEMNFRNLIFTIVVTAYSFESVTAQPKAEDGFRSLFDGKTLAGWNVMNKAKFIAEAEVIKLRGGSGWLRSDEEYGDFILRLEVRWMKPRQDSGIFIRASKEGKNWPDRRYEVQCENSNRVAHIFGAKCTRDAKKAEALLKAPKEWNSFEVSCIDKRCEVKLNNELVCTSDDLKMAKGFIGLQGEGGELEFRNLRIKKIDAK
jgi:hypothetical protein